MQRGSRVAVVGLGSAGSTLAVLLHDAGHDVTVVEQATAPGAVGAGIWLQELGQRVLDRIGLLEPLRAASQEVSRVDVRTAGGRRLVDLSYADLRGSVPALGVHRGTLFDLLRGAVGARGVRVDLGVRVTGARPVGDGVVLTTEQGDHGTYDLVVGADGSRSRVRASLGVTRRDHPYAFGALWAVVDDPDGLAGDALWQGLRGTREYVGVLPTGLGRASIFSSVRLADVPRVQAGGLAAWRERCAPLAGPAAPLLDRVTALLPAAYRDVAVRTTHRTCGAGGRPAGAVLVGDAAHAMSPQLGAGTSLALADAWTLHHALATRPDLATALAAHEAMRAPHVRWYQWWTRLMMPVFQSDLTPLAWPRDLLAPAVCRLPGAAPTLVGTLSGDRTSPWSRCVLPGGPPEEDAGRGAPERVARQPS